MNVDEQHAHEFLSIFDLGELKYEPLGKSTFPDFVAAGNIAIEVRRLNKQLTVEGKIEPLPESHKSNISKIVKEELRSYGFISKNTIAVFLQYKRPFNLEKKAKRLFKTELKKQIETAIISGRFQEKIYIQEGVFITLYEEKGKSTYAYKLRGIHDCDLGGNITKSRYDAMLVAINKKNDKISLVKERFDKFWLILVDYISSRVDTYSVIDLHKYPVIHTNFERIILLSKRDKNQWQDLLPWKFF